MSRKYIAIERTEKRLAEDIFPWRILKETQGVFNLDCPAKDRRNHNVLS
jgi:hypothetical protein